MPSKSVTQLALREQLFAWNSDLKILDWNFHTIGEYLSRVAEGCAVDFAFIALHGFVRMLIGNNEPRHASEDELQKIMELTYLGMKQGAFGGSAELTCTPAMCADNHEIVVLCKVVAEFGVYYCAHHRFYGGKFLEAVTERSDIAKLFKV